MKMKGKNSGIVVLWDIILDQFTNGIVERISPEAPVPIVTVTDEQYKLGWAANVAANIASQGSEVSLIWILGRDYNGRKIQELCTLHAIDLMGIFNEYDTIVKQRITSSWQQLVRVDREKEYVLWQKTEQEIINQIQKIQPTILVVSDYNKWIITQHIIDEVKKYVGQLFVDTKPNHITYFKWADLIKPNVTEFWKIIGIADLKKNDTKTIEKYGKFFSQEYNTNLIVTRSECWASVFTKEWEMYHTPTFAQEVSDVTGAGDTFLATLAVYLNKWYSLKNAVEKANKASGIVVGKRGTATVAQEELEP